MAKGDMNQGQTPTFGQRPPMMGGGGSIPFHNGPGANYHPGMMGNSPQLPGQNPMMGGPGMQPGTLQPPIGPSNPGALIAAILAHRYGGGSPTDPAGAMGIPPTPQNSNAGMAGGMGMTGGIGPNRDFGMNMTGPQMGWNQPPQMGGMMRQPTMGIGPSDPNMLFGQKQQRFNNGQL